MQFFNLDKEVIQSTLFPVLIPIQLPVGYGQVNSDSNSLIVREPILIIIVNKWISTAGFYTGASNDGFTPPWWKGCGLQ